METLKRLISPEYLVVSDPGPMGNLWLLYLGLGLLFGAGLAAALWLLAGPGRRARSRGARAWAWFEFWICLAGLGTVAGRFLGWPGWSARIWPFTLAALALAGFLAYRFRRAALPAWLEDALRILALSPGLPRSTGSQRTTRVLWLLLGLGAHLAGIAFVLVQRYRWTPWAAPLVLALLLAPQALLAMRGQRLRLAALAPLLAAYAAVALWTLYRQAGITVTGWQGLLFPDPMTSLFYTDAFVLGSVAWVMLCHLGVLARGYGNPAILWRGAAAVLLAGTLAWAGVVYLGKRTHGATASDPYAYAQMGIDLAERGTFLHRLSLFEEVMPLQIAWAPLQPVGYHIPRNELGDSPSVWATGASVLLGLGYKLLGETGLYVATPIIALLALAATWALGNEALAGQPLPVRRVSAALAVALTATSTEHVDRLLVPMADAPAQLFTVLALVLALRGMHQLEIGKRGTWAFLLAGLSFGWAYWTRHTQLVLALPVVLAALLVVRAGRAGGRGSGTGWAGALRALLLFAGAALLAALPDIVYRWRHFGGLFATETTELPLMGVQHIGPVAWQMLRDALAAGEWGYLFPLAAAGAFWLARDQRREALVLGSAFAAVLLVHLTYQSLRLRDLISLFPLVNLAVAYGAVALVSRTRPLVASGQRLGRALLPVAAVGWIVFSLALARWAMVDNLWRPGWASFGYMRAGQRAAFDRLAELTPPEAVIGASLNAGAVMMYTGRDAIRPYDSWTEEEWRIFLDAMRTSQRPVYLLDDGGLMADFIGKQQPAYDLEPVEALAVPLFYAQSRDGEYPGGKGWLYRLEQEP